LDKQDILERLDFYREAPLSCSRPFRRPLGMYSWRREADGGVARLAEFLASADGHA
jgi:hypothetical protein